MAFVSVSGLWLRAVWLCCPVVWACRRDVFPRRERLGFGLRVELLRGFT